MTINLDVISQTLRSRICPSCVRYTADHQCSLPADRPCVIFEALPTIAGVVQTVSSDRIDPYIDRIREDLCSVCHEDEHGRCPLRDNLDCALDCYLPLVVDEIEAAMSRSRSGGV
jgi:hypothetical protein